MSISETLIGINSIALESPLNHMIWLQDYKTYGEDSYVFRDKRILHELYMSPIAANDNNIIQESLSYILEEREDIIGRWLSRSYALLECANQLFECDSFNSVIRDETILETIKKSDLATMFFANDKVGEQYANTDNLKTAALDNYIMTKLESNNSFLSAAKNNPDVLTIASSAAVGNDKTYSNIYVVSATSGYTCPSTSPYFSQRPQCSVIYHGTTDREILIAGARTSGISDIGTSINVNKFIKSLTFNNNTYSADATVSHRDNSIICIQLDSVV